MPATAPAHEAHDTLLEIAGDAYYVRRDFDLIRRVEQAFGPLGDLDGRLRRCALPAEDLVRLAAIALQSQASRPPDEDMRQHLADVGVQEMSDQLAVLILHLFAGHRRTVAWLKAEAAKKTGIPPVAEPAGEAGPENPLERALSTGIISLRQQRLSTGRPGSSGEPPFTT